MKFSTFVMTNNRCSSTNLPQRNCSFYELYHRVHYSRTKLFFWKKNKNHWFSEQNGEVDLVFQLGVYAEKQKSKLKRHIRKNSPEIDLLVALRCFNKM